MKRTNLLGCGFAMFAGILYADLPPVASDAPVVVGQWHSNLTAATAKAKELQVPMLVIWGDPHCGYCNDFIKTVMTNANRVCENYVSNRGIVLVFEDSPATSSTQIKQWVGKGDWPLLRVTWWRPGQTTIDSGAGGWQRPNTSQGNFTGSFNNFSNRLESYISTFKAGPQAPLDTSKDKYDPTNDTSVGSAVLAWSDQAKTEQLKLAKSSVTNYTDLADWFTLPVEAGKTYKVSFSGVSGVTTDDPQVALYSDAGTTEVGAQTDLASGDYTYNPGADGNVYIKVWRTASVDTNIVYTMTYQRFAPGTIEFTQLTKSASESATNVKLTVHRVGGTSGSASVQIGYIDSSTPASGYTATAGQDFNGTPSPATLSWADGESADKIVTFTLIKNVVQWEGAETFGVTLTPAPGTTAGADAVVTLLEVDKLVTAAATYNGWIGDLADGGVLGTLTFSVSSQGSISGRATFPMNAPGYAGTFTLYNGVHQTMSNGVAVITAELVKSTTRVPLTLYVNMASGRVTGVLGADPDQVPVELYRNDWSSVAMQALAARYSGYYTVAFPVKSVWPDDTAPVGSCYQTITLDGRGNFRMAGKLGDGTTTSQSGVLFVQPGTETNATPNLCALIYNAPYSLSGGVFGGVVVFGDQNTNGVWDVTAFEGTDLTWTSYNPQSMPVYDAAHPGFFVTLGVSGGLYDKAVNLATFYAGKSLFVNTLAEPPLLGYSQTTRSLAGLGSTVSVVSQMWAEAMCWQPAVNLAVTPRADGLNLAVPASDLKSLGYGLDGQPLYNYAAATNPASLRLTFTRTTGIMRGAFNAYYDYVRTRDLTGATEKLTWTHTAKNCAYEGVLLPERAELGDGNEGDGYYLFNDSSSYMTTSGYKRTYYFNRSFRFQLGSE